MKYGRVSEVTKGGIEVLVNSYRLICREKIGGSQRIPLLTKEGESMENDNRVDLNYVAARLMRISDAKDKDLRKKVEEFQEECLRNIGVNSVNDSGY